MADQRYWDDVSEGEEMPPLVKNCTPQQLVWWAAGSGDYNPIHYDQPFAMSTGLQDIIVHGALKGAFLGQLVHDWHGDAGALKRFACSYRGMDFHGQDIVCRGVVKKKYEAGGDHLVELEIWTETGAPNDNGRPKNPIGIKTTPGTAVVSLPVRG